MKALFGYPLMSGELISPQPTILTIMRTGSSTTSKVCLLSSPLLTKNQDGLHSITPSNKMLFLSVCNCLKDSSQQVAKTNILHRVTFSSLMIANSAKCILLQVKLHAMVEPSTCQILLQVNTTLESFLSDLALATMKSGR